MIFSICDNIGIVMQHSEINNSFTYKFRYFTDICEINLFNSKPWQSKMEDCVNCSYICKTVLDLFMSYLSFEKFSTYYHINN
jgi:hypothetical protein